MVLLLSSNNGTCVPGENSPTRFSPNLAFNLRTGTGTTVYQKNYFQLGSYRLGSNCWDEVFTPQQAYFLDKKIDNGIATAPNASVTYASSKGGSEALDGGCVSGDNYDLSATDVACNYRYYMEAH